MGLTPFFFFWAKKSIVTEKWHEIASGMIEADTAVQLIVVSRLSFTRNTNIFFYWKNQSTCRMRSLVGDRMSRPYIFNSCALIRRGLMVVCCGVSFSLFF